MTIARATWRGLGAVTRVCPLDFNGHKVGPAPGPRTASQ